MKRIDYWKLKSQAATAESAADSLILIHLAVTDEGSDGD
jgi:hypothetical protein